MVKRFVLLLRSCWSSGLLLVLVPGVLCGVAQANVRKGMSPGPDRWLSGREEGWHGGAVGTGVGSFPRLEGIFADGESRDRRVERASLINGMMDAAVRDTQEGGIRPGFDEPTMQQLATQLKQAAERRAEEKRAEATTDDIGDGPSAAVLKRPRNSPLPASGVPVSPYPGLASSFIPSVNAYEGKDSFHKFELDDLSGREAFSWLLPRKWDAQRARDLEDAYYVPSGGVGHLLPQLMPFREALQKKGFVFSLSYKGESMADIAGGMRRGMDYVHEINLQFNFDLGKIAGWKGWSVHTILLNRVGREVSRDRVGEPYVSLMEVYGYTGHAVAHLADFYAQKRFLHNRMDVAFGRMTLTHLYATSPLLCSFMVVCSAPSALKSDPGFSVYPKATWGGRFHFRPSRDTAMQVGLYQVTPLADDPKGWAWGSEHTTGVSIPMEFRWQPFLTRNRLPGHYIFGYAHDTSRYPDVMGAGPARHVVPASRLRSGPMDIFWFEGDQMIYRKGGRNELAGGYLLAGYVHNTPRAASIADEAYGGFSFNGLIPSRRRDRLGVMYSWYHVSHRKLLGQEAVAAAGQSFSGLIAGPQRKDAHVIEMYYGMEDLAPGIHVQPEFEYVIHPGETTHRRDAALVGLKVIANL